MQEKDLKNVPLEELVDIREIRIDESLPPEKRIQSYLEQIKDPYNFRVGKVKVHCSFTKNGPSIWQCLLPYYELKRQIEEAEKRKQQQAQELPEESNRYQIQLTPLQKQILAYMEKFPGCTLKEIYTALPISIATVNRAVKHFRDTGLIERIGGKHGRWVCRDMAGPLQKK